MDKLASIAKDRNGEYVAYRRLFHSNPEVGFNLPKTTDYIKEKLREFNIDFIENVGISGIVGLIKGRSPGKTIALRAIWTL